MVLSVPVPSSRVNCNNFFDFGTATHYLTFTARKSDFENVSKSTYSVKSGSIFTLEKSMGSAAAGAPAALAAALHVSCDGQVPQAQSVGAFSAFSAFLSRLFMVGIFASVLSFAEISCSNGH